MTSAVRAFGAAVLCVRRTRKPKSQPIPALRETRIASAILDEKTTKAAARVMLTAKLGREWTPSGFHADHVQYFGFYPIDADRALVGYDYAKHQSGTWSGIILDGWSSVIRIVREDGKVMAHEVASVSVAEFTTAMFFSCHKNPMRIQHAVRDFTFSEDDAKETIAFFAEMRLFAKHMHHAREHIKTRTVSRITVTIPKVMTAAAA